MSKGHLCWNLTHWLHSAHAGGNWSQWIQLTPSKASSFCDESGTAAEYKLAFFLLDRAVAWAFFMNFAFKWKHRDGSIVEFSAQGWRSDDPGKAD